MNTQDLANSLYCGFFADRDNIQEAYDYVLELSENSSDGVTILTAVHIMMNTISKQLKAVDSNS